LQGAGGVRPPAVNVGGEPEADRAKGGMVTLTGGGLPNALTAGGVEDLEPKLGPAESDPSAVRADAAPSHGSAGYHLPGYGGIGVQDPGAGKFLHAEAGPHALGDHPAVVAGRDIPVPPLERQALRGTDEQSARVCRVRSHRPAEAALEPVAEQAARPVKTDRSSGIAADRQVVQFVSGFQLE